MTECNDESGRGRVLSPAVIALVTGAILLRIGLSHSLPRVLGWDESAYLILGANLLAGNGFSYTGYPELHFPPLHPLIVGFFHLLTSDFEVASNLASSLSGGLVILPVFAIAHRIYGVRTAWLAAVLVAVFPALTVNVLYWGAASEPLYLFLLYGGLAFLLAGLDGARIGMFAAAGVFLGLAYVTRPEAFIYFSMFLMFASIWLWKGLKAFVARTWSAIGLFALTFLLLAAPYIWYLHIHTGLWMLSGKADITWRMTSGKNASMSIWDLDSSEREITWLSADRFKEKPVETVLANPSHLASRVMKHASRLKAEFFSRTNFPWALIVLVGLGLFKHPWDVQRTKYEAFLMTIILVLIFVIPFGSEVRFFMPAFPVLLMWTAHGARALGVWMRDSVVSWFENAALKEYFESILLWVPASMVAGYFLLMIPVAAEQGARIISYGDKEAGLWLKAHSPPDAKVMAREVSVAAYAERPWVAPPNTDLARFLKYARAHNANYVILRNVESEFPYLVPGIANGTPELELVFSFEEPNKQEAPKTHVYRIVSSG